MRIQDLRPGQRLEGPLAGGATLISWSTPHPVYPELALVVWRMDDGRLSFDALDVEQHDVSGGRLVPQSEDERLAALRSALDPAPLPTVSELDPEVREVRHFIGVMGSGLRMTYRMEASRAAWARSKSPDPRDPLPVGRFKEPQTEDGPLLFPVSEDVARAWDGPDEDGDVDDGWDDDD